jgi:hypothetical protein
LELLLSDFKNKAKACKDLQRFLNEVNQKYDASVVKLVDTGDSKSPASDSVAVRVRPLVPNFTSKQ